MNKIKIENVVFCEDARPELGGKFTLLGVSSPELDIPVIPAHIKIAIWISGTAWREGSFDVDFRARDVGGNVVIKGNMKGNIEGTGKCSIVIGPMPLFVQKAGDFIFEWKFSDNRWNKIGILRVNYLAPDVEVRTVPA